MLISHFEAAELQKLLKQEDEEFRFSIDLGKTFNTFHKDKFRNINFKKIIKNKNSVFFCEEDGSLFKIQTFSEVTNKPVRLAPTKLFNPPIIEIAGVRMHNIVHIEDLNPITDAKNKTESLDSQNSYIMEVGFGLGYTALNILKDKNKIDSYEIDPAVIQIAKENPWSNEVFASSDFNLVNTDIYLSISSIKDNTYDNIMFDPPRFINAESLYSPSFYKELHRVLKNSGKIYHYIGRPRDKFKGQDIFPRVKKNLEESGFVNVDRSYLGVIAYK